MRNVLIKMRSTDSEMQLLAKKENAKTTMLESRALIMIFSRHMRELMNYQNSPIQKSSSLEEQLITLMLPWLTWVEPRTNTQDWWSKDNPFKEILMDNWHKNLICKEPQKMKTWEEENYNKQHSRENKD